MCEVQTKKPLVCAQQEFTDAHGREVSVSLSSSIINVNVHVGLLPCPSKKVDVVSSLTGPSQRCLTIVVGGTRTSSAISN